MHLYLAKHTRSACRMFSTVGGGMQSTCLPRADFQQLEVDYCAGKPDGVFCAPSQRGVPQVPILRMYGVTAAGHSVCAFLHGFEPYFFCKSSDGRCQLSPDEIPAFQETLNVRPLYAAPNWATHACSHAGTHAGVAVLVS